MPNICNEYNNECRPVSSKQNIVNLLKESKVLCANADDLFLSGKEFEDLKMKFHLISFLNLQSCYFKNLPFSIVGLSQKFARLSFKKNFQGK